MTIKKTVAEKIKNLVNLRPSLAKAEEKSSIMDPLNDENIVGKDDHAQASFIEKESENQQLNETAMKNLLENLQEIAEQKDGIITHNDIKKAYSEKGELKEKTLNYIAEVLGRDNIEVVSFLKKNLEMAKNKGNFKNECL